jgi:hypothetical protein
MTYKIAPLSLIAALTLPLAACADRGADGTDRAPVTRAPAATVIGEPVNCVDTSRIRDTKVHDDSTIDFRMVNGTIYRNTLPNRCNGLAVQDQFGYRTQQGRLCAIDTITVLNTGGISGPTCGLGQFVPVTLDPPAG